MKKKRIPALLTAAACTAVMFSAMPITPVSAGTAVQNDFEVTYEGWHGTEDYVILTAVDGIGYDGSRGMLVTDRQSAADGAQAEKYFYLEGGIRYNYSVRVYADTDETFRLTLTTVDADGNEHVKELDAQKVKAGKWATLSGSYKAPATDGEFRIVVNTDSENDFRIDDVEITTNDGIAITANAAELGIKDEIVNYGIRSGNIHNYSTINDNGIKARYLKDHNAIECENETKPDATLSKSGHSNTDIKVNLNSCAAIADWCAKNNMAFRGHTMVWHSQTPQFFFKDNFQDGGNWVSSTVMDQRLESYIKNMFAAFATQYPTLNLYAYDICNECISDDSNRTANNGGARVPGYGNGASPWVQVYKSNAFIEKAFTYADKYKPENCHLFYNDYNEYWDHKRDCIIKTCKPLLEKGILQGIGMQSHVDAQANTFSGTTNYLKAMDMYLNNGFEVQVTELDVSLKDGGNASTQAEKYKAILSHAMEWNEAHPNGPKVTLFQVWGADDNHTWLGSGTNPLLYDGSGNPKSAYTAVTSIIPQSQWGDGTKFDDGSSVVVEPPTVNEEGYWFHYTFEDGTEGFTGRASETLTSSSSQAYAGSKSLYVSGRESSWNGAAVSLSSRIFNAGEKYSFSGCVMLDGTTSDTVHFTMSYKDSSGETQYVKIKTLENVEPGQWVQLANTGFEIPSGATSVQIYFETADSTGNFYVDEVIGAPEGTVIAGPGAGVSVSKVRGDVTNDGKINGSDLSAIKRGLLSGSFASAQAKKNADVNQDGKVDGTDVDLIKQFVMAEIKEFPVEAVQLDFTEMAKAFNGVTAGTSLKKDTENNPLYTQRFGADPGWLVYKDRLYVYTTDDQFEYNGNTMKENSYNSGTINCISSADLVNWTDHGAIPVADRNGRTSNGASKWASNAWAPDAAWKTINGKDKFFLYFANNGSGVGVLTADSPTGPWTDPLGTELVSKSNTPNMSDVIWMFDPGVYYDEKSDEGYLFMGGGVGDNKAHPGTGRAMKLNSDMISVDKNSVTKLNNPYIFEDSSLIKIGNLWYYSYCSNWNVGSANINGVSFGNADILAMASENPLCNWGDSYLKSNVFKNTGSQGLDNGGNNHHSIISFKGEYYVLYHCRQLEMRMGVNGGKGLNYRSPQINKATYNSGNGTISCTGSMAGVAQLESLNPYVENRAATMANNYGIQVKGVGNTTVTDIQAGDWIQVKGVDFSEGCRQLTVKASSSKGAVIKVTTGGASGTPFAYVNVPAGSSGEITVATENITGVNNITFEFSGEMEFETWQFS